MDMQTPDWLKPLTAKQERQRAAAGLVMDRNGWKKWLNGKSRRVAGRVPLEDALSRLDGLVNGTAKTVTVRPGSMYALYAEYEGWLTARFRRETGKPIAPRTYAQYTQYCTEFLKVCGLGTNPAMVGPKHFTEYLKQHGGEITTQNARVIAVRAFWRWAQAEGKASIPPFGVDFRQRQVTAAKGHHAEALTPDQCRETCDAVRDDPMLLSAFLLGLTCGYSTMDICTMPLAAVDLDAGIVDFARIKVQRFGVARKNILLPEAVHALRSYERPNAKHDAAQFFLTIRGTPLYKDALDRDGLPTGNRSNGFIARWSKVSPHPFRLLRKTFATVLHGRADDNLIDLMMGHRSSSVRQVHYVTDVDPDLLRPAVALLWQRVGGPSWHLPTSASEPSHQAPPPAPAIGSQSTPASQTVAQADA